MKIDKIKSLLQSVLIEILIHPRNNLNLRQYKIFCQLIKAINEFPKYTIPDIYISVCVDNKNKKFRYVDSIRFSSEDGHLIVAIENVDYSYGSDTNEVEFLRLVDCNGKCKIDELLDNGEGYDLNYWKREIIGLLSSDNVEILIEENWENEFTYLNEQV
jgi:hypothetical protein